MKRYATIEKFVGETPLEAAERLRAREGISASVPLAYAGRLDPMASGKLLILIGDECKRQKEYHGLDKEYEFEVLFGISSDSGDVLGIVHSCAAPTLSADTINSVVRTFVGNISLPYPHFSSKTVKGKPLHTWTLEGRLHEIEIPVAHSRIYKIELTNFETLSQSELLSVVNTKINSIPVVTDERKALGRDFRRDAVRESWARIKNSGGAAEYQVATFRCIASSGTYMRSLAEEIAKRLQTCGLALSIHRTNIGTHRPLIGRFGVWTKRF